MASFSLHKFILVAKSNHIRKLIMESKKARPLMSEVVETLKPLPALKDMASLPYYFQTMQGDRAGSSPNTRNGIRPQEGLLTRNGHHQQMSLSIPNGTHTSPYHHH
ncbi:hypothetical protein ACFX1Z_037182 [Malus domestica]